MKRPTLNADLIAGAVLAFLVVLIFATTMCGCRSATCVPEVVYQDVDRPQPCVIGITPLPNISLPSYPQFDPNDPKEWALQVEQVAKQREALLKARVEALNYQVTEHNRLEPKCAQ